MTQCVDRTTKRFTMRVERQVLRQVWTDDRRTLEVRLIVKNRQSYTNKVVVAFVSPTIPDGQLRLVNYAAIARILQLLGMNSIPKMGKHDWLYGEHFSLDSHKETVDH